MTNARHLPQIDSVYAYNLNRPVEFTHREQPEEGYRYKNRNVLLKSKPNEIHLYHQSIEVDGVLKGITMVSLDADQKRVKKFFKTIAKQVEGDKNKQALYNIAGKPLQLGIFHIY